MADDEKREHRIRIDLGAEGFGSLKLDGIELAQYVQGFSVSSRPGEMTEVVLHLPAFYVEMKMPAEVRAVIEGLRVRPSEA